MAIDVGILKEALGFVEKRQQKKEGMAPTGKAYDPEKQYVVNRDRVGRPRRVLSDVEASQATA